MALFRLKFLIVLLVSVVVLRVFAQPCAPDIFEGNDSPECATLLSYPININATMCTTDVGVQWGVVPLPFLSDFDYYLFSVPECAQVVELTYEVLLMFRCYSISPHGKLNKNRFFGGSQLTMCSLWISIANWQRRMGRCWSISATEW